MTIQFVNMTGLHLDDERPFDAVYELRNIRRGIKALYGLREHHGHKDYVELPEETAKSMIDYLNLILSDMEAVYAEHADLCKLMKHLNKAIRHYEIED